MQEAVDLLASKATPVEAPNGVPIYRVDRGGEVTFHGPSQLVVYPVFDLKRDPYKPDLHWFLRNVEEVVIETLRHYDIESVRDDINTGTVGQWMKWKYTYLCYGVLTCASCCVSLCTYLSRCLGG